MALKVTTSYLEDTLGVFRHYKKLAEAAIGQLSDEQLYISLDPEMNSVAVIMKHMAGNMRSRWSDFLTSDGEKEWRNRDAEFEDPPKSRMELLAHWESGWRTFLTSVSSLTEADLARRVTIRGEEHSVLQAINRQLAHYPYHCGQIIFLAKHLQHEHWRSLSVPRGASEEFNRRVAAGEASQR